MDVFTHIHAHTCMVRMRMCTHTHTHVHTHTCTHAHTHKHMCTDTYKTFSHQTVILTFCSIQFSRQSGFAGSKLALSPHTEQVGTHRLQSCHLVTKANIHQSVLLWSWTGLHNMEKNFFCLAHTQSQSETEWGPECLCRISKQGC